MCVILKPLVPFDDAKLRCFLISRNIFAINHAFNYRILDVYQGFVCENNGLLTGFNYLSAICITIDVHILYSHQWFYNQKLNAKEISNSAGKTPVFSFSVIHL